MVNSSNKLTFSVKNLGRIDEGTFTHKPLTVFCGPNNSGKTWTMYSLYHCYRWLIAFASKLEDEDEEKKEYVRNLGFKKI